MEQDGQRRWQCQTIPAYKAVGGVDLNSRLQPGQVRSRGRKASKGANIAVPGEEQWDLRNTKKGVEQGEGDKEKAPCTTSIPKLG